MKKPDSLPDWRFKQDFYFFRDESIRSSSEMNLLPNRRDSRTMKRRSFMAGFGGTGGNPVFSTGLEFVWRCDGFVSFRSVMVITEKTSELLQERVSCVCIF